MGIKSFRTIGLIYAVLCFFCSCYGVIACFKVLIQQNYFCGRLECENASDVSLMVLVIQILLLTLSAIFSVFVKVGIEDINPEHIQTYRIFVLLRNIIFTIQLTGEVVTLMMLQIDGDRSVETARDLQLSSALLLAVSIIAGVELWVVDGVQRYVDRMDAIERQSQVV